MSKINEDEIKGRFEAVSQFEISPEATSRDLERTRQYLTKLTSETRTSGQNIWGIIMKSKITKFAVAAVIIIAIIIGIHYLGGSINISNFAWADVMEQMSNFRPYVSTHTTYAEGSEPQTQHILRLSLTQRRQIFPDGRIAIYDLGNAKSLTLYPEQKRAIERTYKSPASDTDIYKLTRSMQDMSYGAGGIHELGQKEIEGHITKGFRSSNEYIDITVWVDVQTKLPVQLEYIQVELGRKIITNEFEFGVDFDESLFSTTAPEGYTVEKEEVPDIQEFVQSTTESDLIEGLRALAAFLDGTFPPDIELPAVQTALREYAVQKNLSDSEMGELLMPVAEKYTKAYYYINRLKRMMEISDFHYAGDGVKLGDSEKLILWWLPKDSSTYRVIYGDLRVADVEPENLPK